MFGLCSMELCNHVVVCMATRKILYETLSSSCNTSPMCYTVLQYILYGV